MRDGKGDEDEEDERGGGGVVKSRINGKEAKAPHLYIVGK